MPVDWLSVPTHEHSESAPRVGLYRRDYVLFLQPLLSVEMVVNPHCHRRYGRDYDCPTGDGMNVAVCPAGIRTEVSACQQKGCNSGSYRGFYKRSHVSKII